MKKIAVFFAIILIALSLTACVQPGEEASGPCDEHNWIYIVEKNSKICSNCGAFEGIDVTEQGWDSALSEDAFINVTINYIFVVEETVGGNYIDVDVGAKMEHIVKFADNKVYRKMNVYAADGSLMEDDMNFEHVFTGEAAQIQRKMFYEMFSRLIKEYDNFVYDIEKSIYILPNEISFDVSEINDEIPGTVFETIQDGKIKFGTNGKLEYFEAKHTESMHENGIKIASLSGKILWTFSNYGTTLI